MPCKCKLKLVSQVNNYNFLLLVRLTLYGANTKKGSVLRQIKVSNWYVLYKFYNLSMKSLKLFMNCNSFYKSFVYVCIYNLVLMLQISPIRFVYCFICFDVACGHNDVRVQLSNCSFYAMRSHLLVDEVNLQKFIGNLRRKRLVLLKSF